MVSPQLEPKDHVNVTVSHLGSMAVVHVAGEVDMSSRDVVSDVVFDQFVRRPATLVVDLSEVVFMGSAGLGLLVEVHRRAEAVGTALHIVATTSAVLRSLEISGLDEILPIRRTSPLAPLP